MFIIRRLFNYDSVQRYSTQLTDQSPQNYILKLLQYSQSNQILSKSSVCMKKCYLQMYKQLNKNKKFANIVQNDIKFIKKVSPLWNYSDIHSLSEFINFSNKNGVIKHIVTFWIISMQGTAATIDISNSSNSKMFARQKFVPLFRQQFSILLNILCKIVKKINESFFKTYTSSAIKQTQQQLKCTIRNILTSSKYFAEIIVPLIHKSLIIQDVVIFIPKQIISQTMAEYQSSTFQEILLHQYQFQQILSPSQIFKQSLKKLDQFHRESGIVEKFNKFHRFRNQIKIDLENVNAKKVHDYPVYDLIYQNMFRQCAGVWKSFFYILIFANFSEISGENYKWIDSNLKKMQSTVGQQLVEEFRSALFIIFKIISQF